MSENQRLGRYVLERKLATGGMAEIWLARQAGPEGFAKDVVIKRILRHLGDDRKFVEMFLDEARLAAQLNHPNIVNIFDLGQADEDFFIAMEFIDGWDIEKIVERAVQVQQPLNPAFCARLVADACGGLDYAHNFSTKDGQRVGLVHRDISPQNLLVSKDGVVKLVDFGVAKAATSSHKTQTGAVKGKLSYMSPEQISGARLDGRSDLFALGIVLYEMVTGQRPFGHESELLAVTAILNETPRLPHELHPGTPAELESIILRALAKQPEDRFQSASEMQLALEHALRQMGQIVTPREVSAYLGDLFSDNPQGDVIGGPSAPILAGGGYMPGGTTHEHQSPVRATLAQPGAYDQPQSVMSGDADDDFAPPKRGGGLAAALVFLFVALILGGGGYALYTLVIAPGGGGGETASDSDTSDETDETASNGSDTANTDENGSGQTANAGSDGADAGDEAADEDADAGEAVAVANDDAGDDAEADGSGETAAVEADAADDTEGSGEAVAAADAGTEADGDAMDDTADAEGDAADDTATAAVEPDAGDDTAAPDAEATPDTTEDTAVVEADTSTQTPPDNTPPPPPLPGRVTVQIQTGGGSAQVFIGGRSVGTVRGQQAFPVPAGSHSVRVVHSSGAEQTHRISVSPGGNERLRLRF